VRGRAGDEQARLVLGEHAAGGSQGGGDLLALDPMLDNGR
jgi:hypothetical protein